jgi:FkbM family methyltransferase
LLNHENTPINDYQVISYSQEGEDILIPRYLSAKKGFYIDVGAHHPQRFSNTFLLYNRGWRGINIDPNPNFIKLFQKHRPLDINLNVGCSSENSTSTFYIFDEPALNTLDHEKVKSIQKLGYKLVEKRAQELVTLKSITDSYSHVIPSTIDLLTIDVEGHEIKVLEGFDWATFKPDLILVEIRHQTVASIPKTTVARFLKKKNYIPVAKTFNTVFFKYQYS